MKRFSSIVLLLILAMGLSGLQILFTPQLLVMMIIGIALLAVGYQLRLHAKLLSRVAFGMGFLQIILASFSTIGTWAFVTIALVAVFVARRRSHWVQFWTGEDRFWMQKEYIAVKTTEPNAVHEKKRYDWIGGTKIGQESFEWDDITVSQLAGDTIIDLGNTVLPNQENVVIARSALGRIRVLVPYGVGVSVQCNAFVGQLVFEDERVELKNETIKLYSSNYETSLKKIKIITTMGIGTVEVIEA